MSQMITTRDPRVAEIMDMNERIRRNWAQLKTIGFGKTLYQFPVLESTDERFFYKVVPDGSWKGQRCFIIGGGPSLKDFDFSRLKNELVIGVNRAYEKMDCTIMFSMDKRYFEWIISGQLGKQAKAKFEDFKGYRIWLYTEKYDYPKGVYLLNSLGSYQLSSSMEHGLATGANSGFAALNLAICLGANPIYLLGFDMRGKNGHQQWWHDGYPSMQPDRVYARYKADFEKVAPGLKLEGIKVINLNPQSALRCFEFGEFDKLKPLNMPVVISYYTKNTGYEEEVKRLIGSLRRFSLEYDIEAIENLGSWQKNTHYKAKFIKKMLDKHKGKSVLFLDADAIIRQYPFIFRDLKADMAVHFRDYSRFPISTRKEGKELLSGTLYLANNDKTKKLVNSWIRLNSQNPELWEQKNLHKAIEDWDGEIKELPAQYCQIHDFMAKVENPVITHLQASRRYRYEVGV